jgi:Domain of unknown function (DUF4440)
MLGLSAQESETESKLLILEHMWNEAQVNRDARALEELVSDRFGDVSDKEKFLADIRDPQFKPSMMNIDDIKVRLFHDTAVVTELPYEGHLPEQALRPLGPLHRYLVHGERTLAVHRQPFEPGEEVIWPVRVASGYAEKRKYS